MNPQYDAGRKYERQEIHVFLMELLESDNAIWILAQIKVWLDEDN